MEIKSDEHYNGNNLNKIGKKIVKDFTRLLSASTKLNLKVFLVSTEK